MNRFLILLSVFSAGCSVAQAQLKAPQADDQTLQLWHFDEHTDAQTIDASGKLTATASGGYEWVEGKFGKAIQLNGKDGKLLVRNPAPVHVGKEQGLTVEAWVKVNKQGTTQQIFAAPPGGELEVRVENGEVSYNLRSADGSANVRCTGKKSVTDGKWHHIAGVRDAQADVVKLFIDGKLDAEVPDATAGQDILLAEEMIIGGNALGSEMLGGIIDEVRVSKTARTFEAIAAEQQSRRTQQHVLENEHVRIVLLSDGSKLILRELTDKASGEQFVDAQTPASDVPNLWHVGLRSAKWDASLDEDEAELRVTPARDGNTQTLTFEWSKLSVWGQDDTAAVRATLALSDDSSMSQWRIDVDNRSDEFGVWTVRFPRIANLRKLPDDFLAIPGGNGGGAGEGHLFPDPFNTLSHPFVRTYPCYHQSMQFNAYYGPTAGLYLATHDGDSHLKGFLLQPQSGAQPTLLYEIHHYPADAGVSGTGFTQSYPAVVGTFRGDWYDAAQIYRAWALKQHWCRLGPVHERDDISPWIKIGAFWMLGTFEWVPDSRPHLRDKARTLPIDEFRQLVRAIDVDRSIELVRQAKDFFGYPIIFWTNEWFDGGGDTSPPRYVPMKNLDRFIARLETEFPDVKLSAHIQPKRYSIQTHEYDKQVEQSLERMPAGELAIGPVMPGETNDQHAFPCWATKSWQDFWTQKTIDRTRETGFHGYHVDELGSATSFNDQCFNRDHDHPIGGGTLYAETRRNMTRLLRDAGRTVNPQFAVHHEVLCEIYIDVADAAEVCTSPSNTNIPMWEAVYHDYNLVMGRRIIEWTDRRTYPQGKRDGDEAIDEFVASFAQTFVWGNQPAWLRMDLPTYAPKVAAVTKRFMDARYRAMKFLNVGQMMRPLAVTRELPQVKTLWRGNDTPEHIMPAVISSVWKAPDGSVGIVLANITNQPQTIHYRSDLRECGLRGECVIRQIDTEQPREIDRVAAGVLDRADTVEPRSVMILEITPVALESAGAR